MICFSIAEENGNIKSNILISYEINIQEEYVMVKFISTNFSVDYKLCPNTRFQTVTAIKDYLTKLLETCVDKGSTIMIFENALNNNIRIGYKLEKIFKKGEFALNPN